MNLPELQTHQGAGSPTAGSTVGARCQAELTKGTGGCRPLLRVPAGSQTHWGAHSPCARSSPQHTSPVVSCSPMSSDPLFTSN